MGSFADLRFPPGPGPHPVAILLHGGYWRARYDLAYLGHLADSLRRDGIATWNIEYRRVGNGGGYPSTLDDVRVAARALPDDGTLDLGAVAVLGHSAGGQLALWLAGEDLPYRLRGVVALAPVADLHLAATWHLSHDAAADFLGGSPDEVPERYAAISPAARLPLGVPHILIHGVDDTAVPPALSAGYAAAARSAGDDVALHTLPGGHFEPVDPTSAAWPVVRGALHSLLGMEQ